MNEKRAAQFAPFAALKGYYDLIREKERVTVKRKELTETTAEELSRKMNNVTVGMIVKVIYYSEDEYISTCGMVSAIDKDRRRLIIVKTVIDFDDIYDIEGDGLDDF